VEKKKKEKKEHGVLKLRPSLWNLHPHDIGHFDGVGRSKKFTRPISAADRPLRVVYIHRGKIFSRRLRRRAVPILADSRGFGNVNAAREAPLNDRDRGSATLAKSDGPAEDLAEG